MRERRARIDPHETFSMTLSPKNMMGLKEYVCKKCTITLEDDIEVENAG